ETAVGVVAGIVRVIEFARLDVLVDNAKPFDESLRVELVRPRKRSGIGRHGHGVGTERAVRGPRQIGRIRAARKGHDNTAHAAENREKPLLLLAQVDGIGNTHECSHKHSLSKAWAALWGSGMPAPYSGRSSCPLPFSA